MDDDRIPLPEDAEPAKATPGIGETLRAAREARGVTLEQASDLLRIESQFLVALEDERFDAIGPPVFVRGYLRHYCELLGVDAAPLLDALRRRIPGGEPELKGRRPVEDEGKPPAAMPLAIGAGIVVVAAAIVWWQLGGAPDDDPSGSSPRGSAAVGMLDDAPTAAAGGPDRGDHRADAVASRVAPAAHRPASGAEPAEPEADPGATRDRVASGPDRAEPGTEPAASGASRAEPVSQVAASEPGPAEPVSVAAAPEAEAATAALEIELRFTEDSWTEITGASGERLFYGLASAGREERILSDSEVSVRLGNAGGVSIRVNGEPFAYPPGSRRGSLAVFRLSPPED